MGTEYQEVPFAERAVFAPGTTELDVNLELTEIAESPAGLEKPETTYKFDWVGGQLFVQVSQRILNPTDKVMYAQTGRRSEAAPLLAANARSSRTNSFFMSRVRFVSSRRRKVRSLCTVRSHVSPTSIARKGRRHEPYPGIFGSWSLVCNRPVEEAQSSVRSDRIRSKSSLE